MNCQSCKEEFFPNQVYVATPEYNCFWCLNCWSGQVEEEYFSNKLDEALSVLKESN